MSKEPVSFRADAELVEKIEALAAEDNHTVSEEIREILTEALEEPQPRVGRREKPVKLQSRFRLEAG